VQKKQKKLLEKAIRMVLFSSSTITSLTVLAIILYLFREGIGLFNRSPLEKGYMIAVNADNPVKSLSPTEIGKIFNQDITNWADVGGNADTIHLFSMDEIGNYFTEEELGADFEYVPLKLNELIKREKNIIAFLPETYINSEFSGHTIEVKKLKVSEFLTGKYWYPTTQPVASFGILPIILGTLWVSLGAIFIALPLGLATAIYMAEIASSRLRNMLKPAIELLAGIPSVVFGFFGLIVIVPMVQKVFGLPVGETALAGSIVLAIMALPTIITISEDAIRSTPVTLKEASLALGASRWQTMKQVIIPYSLSGISAASILGIGRAVGETMAVLMVTGNASTIPHGLLEPVRTIPATIAAELGEAPFGGTHYQALFALGIILFLITFLINLSVEFINLRRASGRI
jgi:phosphate transport system permease protein